MKLRKLLFWVHLACGTVGGLVVLIMSVTGALLMYERQIIEWADRGFRVAPPSPDARRVSVEAMLSQVRDTGHALPASIAIRADRTAPAAFTIGRDTVVYVNPYTGAVMGEGSAGVRMFFHAVTDWHRWLGQDGEGRAAARAVTGACNLAFLVLVCTGFYLWWPRKWNRRAVASVTAFQGGLSGKARDFNWHNVIGFWSAIPLFFIILTGVLMSYPWANTLLYTLTRSEPPAQGPGGGPSGKKGGGGRSNGAAPAADSNLAGVDALWTRAEQQVAGWQSITLRLPGGGRAPLTFTIDEGNGGQPQKRALLTLDRSGGVVRWEPFASNNLGRRLRSWGRFVHTGEAFGIAGQTIAGIASAGASVLVWTGLALALRRLRAWRARRRPVEELVARSARA